MTILGKFEKFWLLEERTTFSNSDSSIADSVRSYSVIDLDWTDKPVAAARLPPRIFGYWLALQKY